jgi:hypothetical protein
LGVPALEDKLVQSATAEVLSAVYEQDFLGFSYGFRPGRSQHKALDALTVGLKKRKVNWVLDADDFVVGFQHRHEAERFLAELRERFAKFGLELHSDKTRLIEFGRFAAENRERRGQGKPETFDFLGFTHACGRARNGGFQVVRLTMKKRFRAKLRALKAELRYRLHHPIPDVGKWLEKVVSGYFRYHAVPGNARTLWAFRFQVGRLWFRTLKRRSQRTRLNWTRMTRLIDRWLPRPRILHPYPEQRLRVTTRGRSPVR